MASRFSPGFTFWIQCDTGKAVGIVTHKSDSHGYVIWIAEPIFEREPTLEDVKNIEKWRWCTFWVPIQGALNHKVFYKIGMIEVPEQIKSPPTFRVSRLSKGNWGTNKYDEETNRWTNTFVTTQDRTLPVSGWPDIKVLRKWIDTNWKPEDRW